MSNTTAKETQKQIRAQAREVFNRLDQATKSEGVTLTTNENGVPVPKDWPEALDSIREYLNQHDQLFRLVLDLKALLPETDEKESLDRDEFESMFLTGLPAGDIFDAMIGMSPPKIALIAIDHFLKDSERFEIINPNSLEFAKECERPYLPPKITHTSFEMGSKTHSVPVNGEYWVMDKKLNEPFIITYGPTPNGGISCQLQANSSRWKADPTSRWSTSEPSLIQSSTRRSRRSWRRTSSTCSPGRKSSRSITFL